MRKIVVLLSLLMTVSSVSADSIKPNGCKGPTLCPSVPIIDGCGWHLEAGLLVETMVLSNSDICIRRIAGEGPEGTLEKPWVTHVVYNTKFTMSPGLRMGIGKYFIHDDWMANASVEWLYSKGKLNINSHSAVDGTLIPIAQVKWPGVAMAPSSMSLLELASFLGVNYYLFDVVLSRGSYFSGHFTYEPFAGLKTTWINYNGSQRYSNPSTTPFPTSESLLKTTLTNFWGIGPMAGLHGKYHLGANWGVYSTADFSVLLGESRIKERSGVVTSQTQPTKHLVKDAIATVCPTLRVILGFQYDGDMFDETQHYTLKFGFDARTYFNAHPIVEYPAEYAFGGEVLDFLENISENNSFSMAGFIFVLGWDY